MTKSTELCITRHGETDWNISGILQGWTDVPLNNTGRRQALTLAQSLEHAGFHAVCTSPLSRSLETAQIVAQCWGLSQPAVYAGLKERHFGCIQGMPKTELLRSHPGLHQEIVRRNPACVFEQGESMDDFASRVIDALHAIAQEFAGQRVLIITHGWVMDVISRHLWRLPHDTVLDLKRRNGESIWLETQSDGTLIENNTARENGQN